MIWPERIRSWRERRARAALAGPALIHELRQPLAGLDGALRLLGRELGGEVTSGDGWRLATGQLERLAETLDTYGQLLRAPSGPAAIFEVEPVLARAVALLGPRLAPLGARFALVVEPGTPLASGHPNALLHAVVNLATNAVEALERAPARGRLEIRAMAATGRRAAQVRVADEGAGIAGDARRALFSLGHTTKADPGGKHGIGLAFSRRALRACGGELALADGGDPLRRPWARTEFVIDLAPPPAAPAPRRGRGWRAAAAAALLLAGAAGVGWLVKRTFAGPEPVVAAPVRVAEGPLVSAVEGTLERWDASGGWRPVAVGERLGPEEVVRTPAGSTAALAIGERSRIALSEATQVAVREITSAMQRLRLSRGRLSVDHQAGGARVIVVETERGDASAQAGTARFTVLSSGDALSVASQAGVVRLQNERGVVEVAQGQQAVAFRGEAPAGPAPVPGAVLLKLARATAAAGPPELCAVVEGAVRPGAEVRVDGERVDPGRDGRFSVRVPRRPGASFVSVVTREVAGSPVERRVPCAAIDPRLKDFAVRWGTR